MCYENLIGGIRELDTNIGSPCHDDWFSQDCLAELTARHGPFNYLTQFSLCAGHELTTDLPSTECNSTVAATLPKINNGIVHCALEAHAAGVDDEVIGSTCGAGFVGCESHDCSICYNRFAFEVARLVDEFPEIHLVCEVTTDKGCQSLLSEALDRFESCAGFPLVSGPAHACTPEQVTALRNTALHPILDVALTAKNLIHAQFTLNSLALDLPCDECLIDFVSDVYKFNEDCRENSASWKCGVVSTCLADPNTQQCRLPLAGALAKLASCTGQFSVVNGDFAASKSLSYLSATAP